MRRQLTRIFRWRSRCRRRRAAPSPRARPRPTSPSPDTAGKPVKLVRLQGQVRRARVDQPRLPVRARALRRRHDAGAAEGMRAARTSCGCRSTRPTRTSGEYKTGAQMNAWMKDKRRGAEGRADRRHQRDGPRLRRQDHAAHVRHRSRRQDRLQRRHRRQAQRPRVRPQDREQLRARRARTRRPRASRSRVASTTPYGCSVKY